METLIDRPGGNPNKFDPDTVYQEFFRCSVQDPDSPFGFVYWLHNYCRIWNNDAKGWVSFSPWQSDEARESGHDDQLSIARKMQRHDRLISLKARQVGATTLILAYFLWDALFHPTAFILLISRGQDEAFELLDRIKDMYAQLPDWMHVAGIPTDSKKEWRLSNGSKVVSLSSRRGDSYSATHCLIDEAALFYRANTSLAQVLLNLVPTVGQKGKLFIISKVDKSRSISTFTSMYRSALQGESDYTPTFIPYYVVPGRSKEWYEKQIENSMAVDGTLDQVFESYPSEPEEALSPKSSDKRLAYLWLEGCYQKKPPRTDLKDVPTVPGLLIYEPPDPKKRYVILADPSEGLPTSDPATITAMSVEHKEEVAVFSGRAEPSIHGYYIDLIGQYYNNAPVLFELNEHGHALKLWLKDHSKLRLLFGWADKQTQRKVGWTQNAATKPLLYDTGAKALMNRMCIINNPVTFDELSSIESATLRAPSNQHDDQATTFMLGIAAIELCLDYHYKIEFMRIG